MSGSVNKVMLVGNLGADPEMRHTNDGGTGARAIANLRVATSESWRDKATGEKRERTEWHRVVIFNEQLAKVAGQYLKKGAKVYLEGQLQTRKWTDQAGVERYSTEVVLQGFNASLQMLDRASASAGAGRPPAAGPEDYGIDADRAAGPGPSPDPSPRGGGEQRVAGAASTRVDLDDEVPF